MSSYDKLIAKILASRNISYKDAEKILIGLDFELSVTGSHHIFRKKRYHRTVTLKRRSELLQYQIKLIQEVLKDHGFDEEEEF